MTYNVKYEIQFTVAPGRIFTTNKVSDVKCNFSVNTFTNVAEFKMSKFLVYGGKNLFEGVQSTVLKPGMPIDIYAEYLEINTTLNDKSTIFTGYISDIKVGETEVIIKLEDIMYFLKRDTYDKDTVKDINSKAADFYDLKEIGKLIAANIEKHFKYKIVVSPSFELKVPNFRVQAGATSCDILALLKKIMVNSFFIGNTLILGANFDAKFIDGELKKSGTRRKKYLFTSMPYSKIEKYKEKEDKYYMIQKTDLIWQNASDVRITLEVYVYVDTKPPKKPLIYGNEDASAEKRTLILYGKYTESEIEKLAESYIHKLKYTGFKKGSKVTIFGEPKVKLMDIITLDGYEKINQINSNTGIMPKTSFFVEEVETGINSSQGYYQILTLSNQIPFSEDNTGGIVRKSVEDVNKNVKQENAIKVNEVKDEYQDKNIIPKEEAAKETKQVEQKAPVVADTREDDFKKAAQALVDTIKAQFGNKSYKYYDVLLIPPDALTTTHAYVLHQRSLHDILGAKKEKSRKILIGKEVPGVFYLIKLEYKITYIAQSYKDDKAKQSKDYDAALNKIGQSLLDAVSSDKTLVAPFLDKMISKGYVKSMNIYEGDTTLFKNQMTYLYDKGFKTK